MNAIIKNGDPREMTTKYDVYQFVLPKLDDSTSKIFELQDKLDRLREKFSIVKTGDNIEGTYTIVFNKLGNAQEDKIGQTILSDFIRDNGLDISLITEGIEKFRDDIKFMSENATPDYCEVDIFNNKEPIQC